MINMTRVNARAHLLGELLKQAVITPAPMCAEVLIQNVALAIGRDRDECFTDCMSAITRMLRFGLLTSNRFRDLGNTYEMSFGADTIIWSSELLRCFMCNDQLYERHPDDFVEEVA